MAARKSPKLTAAKRGRMSRSSFALPKGTGRKKAVNQYPMDTLGRARNARARVRQHGTGAEQRTVYRRTAGKYPSLKKIATHKKVTRRK